MEKEYRTKQRLFILEYLKQNTENHITADKIIEHFKQVGNPIGKATVYRYLENLVNDNVIRKYVVGERGSAACYQYVGENNNCGNHYHMKCTECGALIHLDCRELQELADHIYKEHGFQLDSFKTILYGKCSGEHCKKI